MKKLLYLSLMLVFGIAFAACDDDDEKDLLPSEIPGTAQSFISTYFPEVPILRVEKDGRHSNTEYTVKLQNGYELEFDAIGEWTDVDAPAGKTVPDGIVPANILAYVNNMYPGTGINEISRDYRGYEVDLTTGLDLEFNLDGDFIRIDK